MQLHSHFVSQRRDKDNLQRTQKVSFSSLSALGSFLFSAFFICAFLLVLSTGTVRYFYETFVAKAVDDLSRTTSSSVRQTDATYYLRACTSMDVYTKEDLVVREEDNVADHMMKLGVGMFHELAHRNTTEHLREYILRRNDNLEDHDRIRIDPPNHRAALALDPAEDPTVEQFLQELTRPNTLLHKTLEFLTGDKNPAITEISAITTYRGAEAQGYHHDVAPEGSAVQFARTYSHTHSLFVALQDTSPAMGGTRVCPGTHYCGSPQDDVCIRLGFTPPDWHAGTGVLFNQQLCHAGGPHLRGPPRVMVVVSFTRRPDWEVDGRSLSYGLFCFTHWNTWGLTWQDLNPTHYRAYTKNALLRVLRSTGLYKPKDASWGMDFITKQILTWNLAQNGMHLSALPRMSQDLQRMFKFPSFLQGEIFSVSEEEEEDDDWERPSFDIYHTYFRTTLDNIMKFSLALLVVALLVHSCATPKVCQNLAGSLVVCGVLTGVVVYGVWTTRRSTWGSNILSGRLYREPFSKEYPGILPYPTTLPERNDVLIGTRLNSPHLGLMNAWHDYHPGNVAYRESLRRFGQHTKHLPFSFLTSVVENEAPGRFLLQDWASGDWMVLDDEAVGRQIFRDLQQASSPLLSALGMAIDEKLAYHRFDFSCRACSLSVLTQKFLEDFDQLMFTGPIKSTCQPPLASPSRFMRFRTSIGRALVKEDDSSPMPLSSKVASSFRDDDSWFAVGEPVLAITEDGLTRVTVKAIRREEGATVYDIGYESGEDESSTPLEELIPLQSLVSGASATCILGPDEEEYDVLITTVHPDGYLDVQQQAEGWWEFDIDPDECTVRH